jgi:hypothetical protein
MLHGFIIFMERIECQNCLAKTQFERICCTVSSSLSHRTQLTGKTRPLFFGLSVVQHLLLIASQMKVLHLWCVWLRSGEELSGFIHMFWMFGFQQKRSGMAPGVSICKFTINSCNAPALQKRPNVSGLSDASALLPLLPSTLIWLSNQTENGVAPLYSTLQPNKKSSYSVLFAKHGIERLYSQKL